MFRKKVSKLVSSAILLESASVLGLQAQGGVTSDYIKPFDSKLLLRGLDSTESTEVLKKFSFLSLLFKILCGGALGVVVYCILCNVEKKLTVKKYNALIKKLEEEINKLNKMKKEIPDRDCDSEIKECKTKILKLKEKKEKLEKEVDFLEKNKNVYNFLKEINDEINYLDSAHYYLNKQMQIQRCRSEAEEDRKRLEEVCKKINNLGIKVDVEYFLKPGSDMSEYCRNACLGLKEIIENTLNNKNIEIVYKGKKKTRKIEEIDVGAMKITDDKLREDIQEKVLRYKRYVEARELCKGTMSVVSRIKNNESGIKNDETLITEQAKVKISSDDYKKRIAGLLEKVRGVESSMPQGDKALAGVYSGLKKNLQEILKSNKDMGTIENGIDLKEEFVIERQMLRFSGENVNKLKEQINSITEKINTQEFFIKSVEAAKEAAEQLKKNNAGIIDKVSKKERELGGLKKEKDNIEKTAWYKLHRLGNYYNNVPSLESLEN